MDPIPLLSVELVWMTKSEIEKAGFELPPASRFPPARLPLPGKL